MAYKGFTTQGSVFPLIRRTLSQFSQGSDTCESGDNLEHNGAAGIRVDIARIGLEFSESGSFIIIKVLHIGNHSHSRNVRIILSIPK